MSEEQCTLMTILGRNIARRRATLGMTQKFLAIQLGISQEALGKIEKGKMAPKLSRLEDIALELQCSVPYLMTDFTNNRDINEDIIYSISNEFISQPTQIQIAIIELLQAISQNNKTK